MTDEHIQRLHQRITPHGLAHFDPDVLGDYKALTMELKLKYRLPIPSDPDGSEIFIRVARDHTRRYLRDKTELLTGWNKINSHDDPISLVRTHKNLADAVGMMIAFMVTNNDPELTYLSSFEVHRGILNWRSAAGMAYITFDCAHDNLSITAQNIDTNLEKWRAELQAQMEAEACAETGKTKRLN